MRRSVKLLVLVPLLATAVCVCLFTYPGRRRGSVPSIGSRQSTPVSKEPVVQAPSRPSDTSSPTPVSHTSVTGKLTTGAITKFRVSYIVVKGEVIT